MDTQLPGNKKTLYIVAAVAAFLCIGIGSYFLLKKPASEKIDPAFGKYIDSYTSGVISKRGTILIHLASEVSTLHNQGQAEDQDLFEFDPAVKGKSYWLDAKTIEFRPAQPLAPGTEYHTIFKLGKVTKVAADLDEFEFNFRIVKPSFEMEENGLKAAVTSSLDKMKFTGVIYTADYENDASIQKLITVTYQGKNLPVKWAHNSEQHTSAFTIENIVRGKSEQELQLKWDGAPINSDKNGESKIKVPAVGDFKVLTVKAIQDPEQYVLVQFSDPILVSQDLTGLISVSNQKDLRYTIDGSEIKIYAPDRLEGDYSVTVNEGIENIVAKKITATMAANVNFENQLPSVTIPGKGTILPNSGKLTFPFEAINLNAVDVTIIKIYENNIPQYLQANDANGGNDLRRVAKPVIQKTIRLDGDKSLNLKKKNRFSLDIDKFLRAEPGAIYRITIGFRKSYSIFACQDVSASGTQSDDDEDGNNYGEKIDEDDDFWTRYNNYYPAGYNWDEREDPCSDSYYTTERWASRNVLASNIGLITKRGNNGQVTVIATDILTTMPLQGVELQLLDYQQQVLQTATTNSDGLATIENIRKPFILIAKKGSERGYLKLDDGSSLPLSRFNVNGDVVQNGIKGFIYGERGVWRPGDSIYMSFILEDKENKLPEGHPISLEFYNPKGQLNNRIIQTKSLNGFYTFRLATNTTAPTGNWLAKVKVGGAVFQKSVKVETVMPNRLKINLDFGGKKELVKGTSANGTLSARWLFGASVQNLKAKVDVTLNPGKTTFKNFNGYVFDDPTSAFQAENKTIFDGRLNGNGSAAIQADISSTTAAPGILNANFTTKVFEPGGNFSINNFSIPYHVYNSYAGIKVPEGDRLSGRLLTDQNHVISIANVDTDGKLIGGNRQVQVELYKIQWRWWWDQEDQSLSNFTQNRYNQLLRKEVISLTNGTAKWNLKINYPDWGRYLVRVKDLQSGHTTGETLYIDWPGWAEREQQNNPTDASMLSFTANKEKYKVGEEVTLTIPSSKGGRGLVSIENGSKVLKTWWIETQQGQTSFKFNIEKEMAPNVYANVTLLQPHAQTANDLPIRMYGVIPLLVEDPQTTLKPVISIAGVLKPETQSSITVSESSGKAMTYTIALVDDGLLDLTRFKTPDPHGSFYAREALGVKTWDLFDQVIGAWGGDLERILSIGGDGDLNRNVNPAKANRFKPVVKFLGPFAIGKGEKKTHQFKLPQYVGSVRAMVIAGQDGAYGYAEKTVEVKQPLMLLATLPRVAGPGETFKLPITVFAMENRIKTVNLKIETNNMLTSSGTNQVLTFDKPGEKMAFADINVKDLIGVAKVKITATSGSDKTSYEVELDVRNPNPYITAVTGAELPAGKSWSATLTPIGTGGTNSSMLEISAIPPMNLTKRLNYLIQYPHGCVEQITSAAFPQLLLNQVTDLTEPQKANITRNVKAAINRLRGFQTTDGGLSYWPGEGNSDDWGTNYAGHFMLEAQARGYSLPAGFLDQWKKYQRNKAVSWIPNSANFYGGDLIQSYRLYLLALAKSPEIGAMNRLKEFQYLSSQAKWRLADAYKMIGQNEIAGSLVKGLTTAVKQYNQLGQTFGSDLRDQAMIMETLTDLGNRQEAGKLLQSIAAQLSQDQWYSTQTTAYSLIAIAKYCGVAKTGPKLTYTYALNGSKKSVSSGSFINRFPGGSTGNVSVVNQGSNRLYVRLIRQGQAPVGSDLQTTNDPSSLDINVVYKTQSGEVVDAAKLPQGKDFVAEVTIKNPGNRGYYEQMALTQIFSSGWEIINTRLNDQESAAASSSYTYRDIRDDRVLTYFNIRAGETLTFKVLLNASYLGRYYLPATNCSAMYDNSIQATTTGKWVEVVK
ncbi:hypothetical protein GS399_05670 [Pedobacter sp. HMF7647]|uniref:Alpha-2-macroglobulin n=1 Tax=Hufsiella arboris TaxID=2695275 RepID=A0A7K1Y7A9_9SPHI|nr:MG2 domain-containing protein [Hufsiella arboris]MXV50454.1 hypothetical protein [Hufsiella arboris]